MAFKGKDGSGWKEASAIYGKDATGWLYAKEVFAKDATGWKRAWTDCRKHDEGGRGWTPAAGVTEYQGSCGNRESRVRTDYSKTGCEGYSRYTSWVSSPDCNSTCFDASTATVYRNSCASRESTTRTTYTAKSGSGCTTYYVDGTWVSSPNCGSVGSACWSNVTNSYVGQTATWAGVSYDVYNVGGGEIWASRTDATNQYCGGGYLEIYTLWSCGASQGVTYNCYPI